MLSDDHLKYLVDFTDSNDCFPGVDIAGGICYFLWERMYSGKCTITNIANGPENVLERSLHETKPFIRYNQAISIIHKVAAHKETVLSTKVSSQKPFGLRTYVQPEAAGDLILRYSGGTGPYPRNKVLAGFDMIDKWKVMTSYLTYDHAGRPDKDGKRRIISTMETLAPKTICTETYIIIDALSTKKEADNLMLYLKTSFVRFLIAQVPATQHLSKASFSYVPVQDYTRPWTDKELYAKYGLTDDEVAFIESMIKPME